MTDPMVFLLAVLSILAAPGPTNALLATGGATLGIRRSLPLLLGAIAGYLVAITAIRIVLAPLIVAYPLVGVGLKIAVAVYLCWIAIKLWLSGSDLGAPARVTLPVVFTATLLNPKSIIFALGILPTENAAIGWYLAGFAISAAATGFGWVLIGRAIGSGAGRHARVIPRVASVVLAGFAGLILSTAFG